MAGMRFFANVSDGDQDYEYKQSKPHAEFQELKEILKPLAGKVITMRPVTKNYHHSRGHVIYRVHDYDQPMMQPIIFPNLEMLDATGSVAGSINLLAESIHCYWVCILKDPDFDFGGESIGKLLRFWQKVRHNHSISDQANEVFRTLSDTLSKMLDETLSPPETDEKIARCLTLFSMGASYDCSGFGPLDTAARRGSYRTVQALIASNTCSVHDYRDALRRAAEHNKWQVVELLIPHCQLSSKLDSGTISLDDALQFAIADDRAYIVKLFGLPKEPLEQHNLITLAVMKDAEGTALHLLRETKLDYIKQLKQFSGLNTKADDLFMGYNMYGPDSAARFINNLLKMAICTIADLNQLRYKSSAGVVSLLMSLMNNVTATNALVKAGADLSFVRAEDGCTLLMAAAKEANVEVLKACLAAKADVTTVDKHGKTAWYYLTEKLPAQCWKLDGARLTCVDILLQHGASPKRDAKAMGLESKSQPVTRPSDTINGFMMAFNSAFEMKIHQRFQSDGALVESKLEEVCLIDPTQDYGWHRENFTTLKSMAKELKPEFVEDLVFDLIENNKKNRLKLLLSLFDNKLAITKKIKFNKMDESPIMLALRLGFEEIASVLLTGVSNNDLNHALRHFIQQNCIDSEEPEQIERNSKACAFLLKHQAQLQLDDALRSDIMKHYERFPQEVMDIVQPPPRFRCSML